jgi:hypothetical protein
MRWMGRRGGATEQRWRKKTVDTRKKTAWIAQRLGRTLELHLFSFFTKFGEMDINERTILV